MDKKACAGHTTGNRPADKEKGIATRGPAAELQQAKQAEATGASPATGSESAERATGPVDQGSEKSALM